MAPVWVIDDNAAMAESLAVLLNLEGIKAVALTSGIAVMARLGEEQPAAMVLDLHMPHNGNSLLAELQLHPEWTFPVILLTGYAEELDKVTRGRVFKVLEKSIDPLEIVANVKRALGRE